MASEKQFCPDCGSPEVEHTTEVMVTSDGVITTPMTCRLCGWQGRASDTLGMLTTERVWDTEAVANLLLRVCTKQAAGPLVQVFRFVGLIEPGDQEGQDKVMRATFEAMITAAFQAAADHYAAKTREDAASNGNRKTRRRIAAEDRKK